MIEEKKYLFLIVNQGDNITYSLVELTMSEILKMSFLFDNLNSCAFRGEPNITAYRVSWLDFIQIEDNSEKLNIPHEEYAYHNIILWHDMEKCHDYYYSFKLPEDEPYESPLQYIYDQNYLHSHKYPTLEEIAFDYRAGKWVD